MPKQIKPDFVKIILNYIINYPTHGLRRISDELAQQEIIISETGVDHVLKRANLNHRLDRLFYAQEHSDNPVITKRYLREVEKKKETHIEAFHPGDLLCQDTFYVSTIKGLERIYQQAYGSYSFAKVYTNKKADSAIDFVKTKLIPVYGMFHIPLDCILADDELQDDLDQFIFYYNFKRTHQGYRLVIIDKGFFILYTIKNKNYKRNRK